MAVPLSDLSLSRRLERAERDSNARFVEARAAVSPDVGAAWIDVGGTYAMFDGVESPCTQTFGFGLFSAPSSSDLDTIERFYAARSAPVFHEVSPIADPAHLELLASRGYRPIELTSVLYQPLDGALDVRPHAASAAPFEGRVRIVEADAWERWAQTSAAGWSDVPGAGTLAGDLMRVVTARPDVCLFLAELEGRPVAAGALNIDDGVALLAGASTVPDARHRGAQIALLSARLSYASQHGCDLAMMGALPGSGSQRNAERNGFRIAYTRTKWQLSAGLKGPRHT
jgi:hypothetical protein